MSPRRKIEADEPDFFEVEAGPTAAMGPAVIAAMASVLIAAAITAGTLMLVSHRTGDDRPGQRCAGAGLRAVVHDHVHHLDPFNANAYTDRILAQGTGEFAKMFNEKQNEILIQVAQAEPTTGSVVAAGVQRWNDNGSADVLVATKITSKSPDGKSTIESGNRWVATAIKEGQQWKISQLIQVI